MKTFRNTSSTNLGLPMGIGLKSGETATVEDADAAIIMAPPHIQSWLLVGALEVVTEDPVIADEPEEDAED